MTTTIWKFKLPIEDDFTLQLPKGYKILTVQMQNEAPCLWVLVSLEEKEMETATFRVAGTGHPIDMENYPLGIEYINSFQMENGKLMFHLFFVETDAIKAMMKKI
jgi:hypothetical protein